MENERWLPVVGYEGLYEVSDLGRVRSVDAMVAGVFGRTQIRRGKILKQSPSGSYLAVVLSKCGKIKTHRIHKLVLEAFVGPRPEGCEARHFPDRSVQNNRLSNLSWGTPVQNAADREIHGTSRRGAVIPRDVVDRIAAKNRGRKATAEQRAAMSARRTGVVYDSDVRSRMSSAQLLRYQKERELNGGVVFTDHFTAEVRQKMSRSRTGKKHSPETIAKMRESAIRRWRSK